MPPEFEKELRNLYLSLNELLNHFWRAFPLNTPDAEAKAIQMHETLQRFQMVKVKPFEVRIRSHKRVAFLVYSIVLLTGSLYA